MIRTALIIFCNKSKYGDLPGAEVDANNWARYLKSNAGGGWYDREITKLKSPSRSTLDQRLSSMSDADIAFVAFSGHGFHKRGYEIDESYVCINDTEDISVVDLNSGADRTIIVADSCRGIVIEAEERVKESNALAIQEPSRIRARYESAFSTAERGAIYMYACDIDEAAGESGKKGGYFSRSLIECGCNWATSGHLSDTQDTRKTFDDAKATVKRLEPQQNPQYVGGRRMRHFPFAVR